MTLTGTHVGSKRLSIEDFILITSIETVELKFLKLGYLRSKNTTANQPQSGPVREKHLNSQDNNEDRNAPIVANQHATNSDT